ncbi:MAG TPA: phage tail sheath subtilisin-like domain-containing protein [bacterium]|nr:phage tail sheath subtilisin-like domain-containing protein [bacterium]
MSDFLHGVETIVIAQGARTIEESKTAVVGIVGTAPIFETAAADRPAVNVPTLLLNDVNMAKFGSERAGYSIPEALAAFDSGPIIAVNVFDPAVHKTANVSPITNESHTFPAGDTVTLDHTKVSSVVVKSSDGNTTYQTPRDYTVVEATGVITRVAEGSGGTIPALATVKVDYAYAVTAAFNTDDEIDLGHVGITGLVVKSSDGVTTYDIDDDYTYDEATGIVTRVSDGDIAAEATVRVAFNYADPSKVVAADIIGTVDGSGNRTGMQALLDSFSKFGFNPKIIIAPGYSSEATVRAAMQTVCASLKAVGYVDGETGWTFAEALAARGEASNVFNTSDKRTMLCFPKVKAADPVAGGTKLVPYSAYLAAARARKDRTNGYWWSTSNTELSGVVGMERNLTASINDPNSEVNQLNAAGIVTIFNSFGTGYKAWGNRNASYPTSTASDSFECVLRVGDVIEEAVEKYAAQYSDNPIDVMIEGVIEGVNAFLRKRTGKGNPLAGGRCYFEPSANDATDLAAGHITFDYDMAAIPPAERITFRRRVNIQYLTDLTAELAE